MFTHLFVKHVAFSNSEPKHLRRVGWMYFRIFFRSTLIFTDVFTSLVYWYHRIESPMELKGLLRWKYFYWLRYLKESPILLACNYWQIGFVQILSTVNPHPERCNVEKDYQRRQWERLEIIGSRSNTCYTTFKIIQIRGILWVNYMWYRSSAL